MKSCKQKCPERKKPIGKIGKVICNEKTQKWTAKGSKVVYNNNSYDNLIIGSLSVSKRWSGVWSLLELQNLRIWENLGP